MIERYIWNIFCIAKENNVDIGVGRDMFMKNVKEKKEIYSGANLDYTKIGEEYENLSSEQRTFELQNYTRITRENFFNLVKYFNENNVEEFNKYCT